MEEQSVIVSSDKIMLWALDGNHIPFREGAPEMHHDPPPNAITFHSLAWNKKDELQFYSTDNYKPHRYIKFFYCFSRFGYLYGSLYQRGINSYKFTVFRISRQKWRLWRKRVKIYGRRVPKARVIKGALLPQKNSKP